MEKATDARRVLGQAGEDAAALFLEARGFEIIARNWRPHVAKEGFSLRGEIDLIARSGKTLCFIEVKTRSASTRGAPQEAVNRSKQRQLSKLANAYLSLHENDDVPCRFDVVEVWMNSSDETRLQLHENAFEFAL